MYEQIAANKRRAVVYVALFFVIWVGLGALLGWIVAVWSPKYVRNAAYAPYVTSSANVAADVATGAMIAGFLALAGIAYTLTAGTRLVLSVSGARPADPTQYRQLHNIVEALAIGDGVPKPAVYVIGDPSPNAFATGISPEKAAITAPVATSPETAPVPVAYAAFVDGQTATIQPSSAPRPTQITKNTAT